MEQPNEVQSAEANPAHGTKGDFRRVTITLPPLAYEMLIQESARRKIAGESNHVLSAIIREGIFQSLRGAGQPLLPIETAELKLYKYADGQGRGERRVMENYYAFQSAVVETDSKVFDQLIEHVIERGFMGFEKYHHSAGYRPYAYWNGFDKFFHQNNATIKMWLTIPGRMRYEGLQAREQMAIAAAESKCPPK